MSVIEFGPVEDKVRTQIEQCAMAEAGAKAVLCADNHLGYSMPIGGVVAYQGLISPSAVGYDIACGNGAVKTDALVADIDVSRVMDEIWKVISFGVGRQNNERVDHAVIDRIAQADVPFQRGLAHLAAQQLGTVGSGNHYVDLFEDRADGYLWIGVHFGSRGFGHKTATWALEQAGSTGDDMMALPTVISLGSELGADYARAMALAGEYAYAGRDWVLNRVLAVLGAKQTLYVHNHHNFAWMEEHGGQMYMVHRKGATPAFPGQLGFVGGTMGEDAVILAGKDSLRSAEALYSTVHGAGRVLSRRKAAGKTRRTSRWNCQNYRKCAYTAAKGGYFKQEGGPTPTCPDCGHKLRLTDLTEQVAPGLVDWKAAQADVKAKGIELRGAGADEAPECYKRLNDVLAYHGDTIEVLHRLRPVGVAMAGAETYDPYKD